MAVLYTDLDNTIIYSYKHDIGPRKKQVELYQGMEISFVTEKTYELLRELKNHIRIIPTSTRTVEQYGRIDLGLGTFPYALVCNGGILLCGGRRDEAWYRESLRLTADSRDTLQRALELLERDARRSFALRFIEDLFVFTKCDEPEAVADGLRQQLDLRMVDVLCNGTKLYVIPKALSKGAALRRMKEYLEDAFVVAAGDSAFDISMLREADLGFAPGGFQARYGIGFAVEEAGRDALFSDAFLERLLHILLAAGGNEP